MVDDVPVDGCPELGLVDGEVEPEVDGVPVPDVLPDDPPEPGEVPDGDVVPGFVEWCVGVGVGDGCGRFGDGAGA